MLFETISIEQLRRYTNRLRSIHNAVREEIFLLLIYEFWV